MVIAVIIGGAATVGAAVIQADAAGEAADAQKAAARAQARSAAAQAARDRMQQIREARIRAGAIAGGAAASGVGQASSGVAGSIASIGSQTGANIGAINVTQGFAEIAAANMQRAADANVEAQKWQMIVSTASSITGSLFEQAGGWTSIFGGNTNKPAGGK